MENTYVPDKFHTIYKSLVTNNRSQSNLYQLRNRRFILPVVLLYLFGPEEISCRNSRSWISIFFTSWVSLETFFKSNSYSSFARTLSLKYSLKKERNTI